MTINDLRVEDIEKISTDRPFKFRNSGPISGYPTFIYLLFLPELCRSCHEVSESQGIRIELTAVQVIRWSPKFECFPAFPLCLPFSSENLIDLLEIYPPDLHLKRNFSQLITILTLVEESQLT